MSYIIVAGGETKEALGQLAQENVVPEENSEKNINTRPQENHENKNSPSLLPVPYFPDVVTAGPPSCNSSPATPTATNDTPTPASATPSQAATPTPACRGLFTAAAGRGVSPLTPTTSSSSKQRSIRGIVPIVVFFRLPISICLKFLAMVLRIRIFVGSVCFWASWIRIY